MHRSARILILTTLVVYLLALGALLAYSLHDFPTGEVLRVFQRRWTVSNGLYLFIDRLIPIQLTAVILAFSLLVRTARSRTSLSFFALVRPVLVVVIVTAVLYTAAAGLAAPMLAGIRADAEHRSRLAESFLNHGDESYEREAWAQAVTEYEAYLAIVPSDAEVENQLAEARKKRAETAAEEQRAPETSAAAQQVLNQNEAELVVRAREALAEDDFISAHYWAQLALELDPGRPEAQDIVREANRRMTSPELSNLDERERALYMRKRDAYQAMDNGEVFTAHRIFSELEEEIPRDRDVQRYLSEVEDRLREIAFFTDEIERNMRLPGSNDILFTVSGGDVAGDLRFVSIGTLAGGREGTYARDVEVMDVEEDGEIRRQVQAPYAKLRDGRLVLQAVERGSGRVVHRPSYSVRASDGDEPPYLEVRRSARELHALRHTGPRFSGVSVAELMMMEDFFPELGYSVAGVRLALAMRLVRPFSFVILSFFAVAAAWAWRTRYIARPPILVWVVLPAIPFVLSIVTTLYHYLHRVFLGAVVPLGGLTPLIIATVLIQALLLLVSLALLAGQSSS
ncbi:MAG: LptF/LptG family permease [Spirochaetaceae bacterium]